MSLLVPLTVVAILAILGLKGMEEKVRDDGFGWIDPAALTFGDLPAWADPRWGQELDALLLDFPPFRTDEFLLHEEFRTEIEALSFVARAEITAILWPDGLAMDLELHEPVACVPVGNHFQPVAANGTLLTGLWSSPPLVGTAPLPVLGPMTDAWGLFDLARAGDYLVEPEHLDALDVALSLTQHLAEDTRAALGRVVIDARRAREATVSEPGIRLLLEGGRLVLFGRAPFCGEPGELAVDAKWRSLREALALLDEESAGWRDGIDGDWDVVDVRWDRPEIVLRHPPLAALTSEETRPAPRTPRATHREAPPATARGDRPRVH